MRVIVYRSRLLARSETFIKQQTLALRRWEPVVVGERCVEDGLDLSGLDVRMLRDQQTRLTDFCFRLCRFFWLPHALTVKRLAAINADIIHIHFGTDAVDIWPHVRELGLPTLVTLHGSDINIRREYWEGGKGGRRWKYYPRRLLELASQPNTHFIAVSEAIRERAIDYGIPAEKVSVRYIGVDTIAFCPGRVPIIDRAKRILFVGRLVEKKGTQYLIRAFSEVLAIIPDAELVIAGDGPLRGSLQDLAEDLGAPVKFLGAVTSQQVMELMRHSRVFCLPSITAENGDAEGLPIAILEAEACGLAVATSARGGVGEAVQHGETGLCFEEGNVEELTDCLVSYLLNDAMLATCAAQARSLAASHFDLRVCSNALEDLYSALVADRNKT